MPGTLRIPTCFLSSFLFFPPSFSFLFLFFSFFPPPSHDQSEPETAAEAIPSSPFLRVLSSSSLSDSQLFPFSLPFVSFTRLTSFSLPINNSFRPISFSPAHSRSSIKSRRGRHACLCSESTAPHHVINFNCYSFSFSHYFLLFLSSLLFLLHHKKLVREVLFRETGIGT